MNNYIKAEFAAIACNESLARIIAAGFILELDPTLEEISEVKTAVSEAVTNAIIHGYKNSSGNVIMSGEINGQTVKFTISDKGAGIADIALARQPLYTGEAEMERSGMGFTIMEEFTDDISVESTPNKGTSVTLTKHINGAGRNG